MAEVKFTRGTQEFSMFMDFWSLYQKYYLPEKSDAWWEEALKAVDAFVEKYGGSEIARGMGLAMVNDLEARWKSATKASA